MATLVQTNDVTIVIDPAVSLAPRRYGLPPHEVEWERLTEIADEIYNQGRSADVIIITHYHYDHHDPGKHISLDLYNNKILLIKDPKNMINVSQRIRAHRFLKFIEGRPKEIFVADSRTFSFKDTKITISKPVMHGYNDRLGYVCEVLIDDGSKRFLFSSDIEGPVNDEQLEFILRSNADLIIIDGPPTYLLGYKFDEKFLNISIKNLRSIVRKFPKSKIIVDHHLIRDLNYTEFFSKVSEDRLLTAAEYMGKKPILLEARRRELYGRIK
jgi:hypothetical protein